MNLVSELGFSLLNYIDNSEDLAAKANLLKLLDDYKNNKNKENDELINAITLYNVKYEQPRNENNINYENYYSSREILYNKWKESNELKDLINLVNLLPPDIKYVPDIYTYTFNIKTNFSTKPKKEEEPKAKKEEPKAKKECPEDKEINPVTGRCVNKCKENEIRDIKTGKCIKKEEPKAKKEEPKAKKAEPKNKKEEPKAKKEEPKDKKECPEGKEINPVTGRCVNKCKENEIRDDKTGKCIKKTESKVKK